MRHYEIILSPPAEDDLRGIYDWVAIEAGHRVAARFIKRIENKYQSLRNFPERGTRHDRIMPGLRIFGMAGRVTIAFRVEGSRVAIFRISMAARISKTHSTTSPLRLTRAFAA